MNDMKINFCLNLPCKWLIWPLLVLQVYLFSFLQATATLVQAIKGEADSQTDSDIQKRLMAAAKVLADATAKMVEAAKVGY